MKDLKREIEAYALQNAIEFGKADVGRVLPKLFQHGLEKSEIKEVMPVIAEIVKSVNRLKDKDRLQLFEKMKDVVKKHEEKEKDLPEIKLEVKKVVTRMAPEPSKYIHLGHAITFILNKMYADRYKGQCVLRFEDTNPEKVAEEYVKATLEDLDYLGIDYGKPRYVSDDMKELYAAATKLVKDGHAYVCHCPREKMQQLRHDGIECEHRQFPLKTQIKEWGDLMKGKVKKGDAILRFKGDMQSQNHVMRDPALFRKLDAIHYRQGDKYSVWPLYDFYNPIEDSLMGVTLILRSNEFDMRVELQDTLKKLLKLKKQQIVQYGRFNVKDFTTKGREIRELFNSGELMGWDDPRLITIRALRRRGIQKEAIYELTKQVGLAKHPVNLEFDMLAAINRKLIDPIAPRFYFVSQPKQIMLQTEGKVQTVNIPIHPGKPETRNVEVGDSISISTQDFNENKGKEVRLLHFCNVKLNDKSKITSMENKKIPKIQWVSRGVNARIMMPDGKWLEGLAEEAVSNLKVGEVIQFERFGFVRFDSKEQDRYNFWFAHQ